VNGSNGRLLAGCPAAGYTSRRNAENAVAAFAKAMSRKFYTERVIAEPKNRRRSGTVLASMLAKAGIHPVL
jgi:hypothetical protein